MVPTLLVRMEMLKLSVCHTSKTDLVPWATSAVIY